MHGGEDGEGRLGNEHVEALALVDESTTVSSHINESSLLDLPNGLVNVLQLLWDFIHVLN